MRRIFAWIFPVLTAFGSAGADPLASCADGTAAGMMPMAHPSAFYGTYPAARESSGTSWAPDSSAMSGLQIDAGRWDLMAHGFFYGVYNRQGGARGGEKTFISNMISMDARSACASGVVGLHGMLSLDPLSGADGYPLIFQTGESYAGRPLIDRQHPHDFFSELAISWSVPTAPRSSLFAYVGLPGEPALGPPVYLHRFSGMNNPEAPISHHWLDSTHVTFGVATMGYVHKNLKIESSAFRGREPDENRWNIECPRLDSYSLRVSVNPGPAWACQASYGYLKSPEALEPDTDMVRCTASVIYSRIVGSVICETTAAWGQNDKENHAATDAFLLESALSFRQRHIGFFRAERVDKDELFASAAGGLTGTPFPVNKFTLGYMYEFMTWMRMRFGLGGLMDVSAPPRDIQDIYGIAPFSYMFFLRARLL